MTTLKRRALLGTATTVLATPTILMRRASAADPQVHVGIYSSGQGNAIKKSVIPKFQEDYKCQVIVLEGATLSNTAALRATRNSPTYSAMCMDDVGITQAKSEGLLEQMTLAEVPNMANVIPRFVMEDSYGIGFSVSSASLFIATDRVKPFQSYAELWEPRFRKRYLMMSPQFTQSLFLLMIAAALTTGKPLKEAQYQADDGWPKLAELKPNVLTFYTSESMVMQLAQGQADVGGVEYSKAITPYTSRGVPVAMTYPKEGAFTGINAIGLPKNAPNRELGCAFINRLLDVEVQALLSEATVAAPSITGVTIKPELAQYIAYPQSKMEDMHLFTPDWNNVISRRAKWVEMYNETFSS
jgi:putative spermidine/putrescine transport system substrate-binding protein